MRPLSSIEFPKGFSIIVDTREKSPVISELQTNVPIVHKALKYGDYSVVGLETFITIERKSAGDFLMCLGTGRKRFTKQIDKLQKVKHPFLLVEDSLFNILHPLKYGSLMSPQSVWGSILAIQTRTNISVMFIKRKWLLQRWLIEVLLSGWHSYHKGYK